MNKEKALKIALEYIERWNKNDFDRDVAEAVHILGATEEKQKRFMPVIGCEYHYLSSEGEIETTTFTNTFFHKGCYATGNMFRTEKETELHKLRLISMVNKWLPEDGKEYFFYHEDGEVYSEYFDRNDVGDIGNYHIGNCHQTRKQAEEWGRTKSKAFEIGRSNE